MKQFYISKNKFLIVTFSIIFSFSLCSTLPEKPKTIPRNDFNYLNQYLDFLIPSQMKQKSVVGLGISLISENETLYSKGFGFSDAASGLKVTPDTVFRVGSISKIVNLVLIMKLVEEGKLNLDVGINRYLPELKLKSRFENSKPITIRLLLTHHSGVPSDRMKGFFSQGNRDSLEKLIADLNDEYVSSPPDKVFSYSNLGHSILGRIAEKVLRDSYDNIVSNKVFEPLGMDHSFFDSKSTKKIDFSKGYGGSPFTSEINEAKLRDLPAGFLNSSVRDLSKLMQMFLNNGKIGKKSFLKESTLEEIYKSQHAGNLHDDEIQIGLGFFRNTFNFGIQVLSLEHGGDTFLFHSMMGILPRHKLGVVVLSNSEKSPSLVHFLAKKSLEISLETKFGIKPSWRGIRNGKKIDMRTFAGTYQNGNLMEVEVENGKVFSKLLFGSRFILPDEENEWQLAKIKILGLFDISQGNLMLKLKKVGDDRMLYTKSGGNISIWGSKISAPAKEISDTWKNRIGKYKILNDDKDNSSMLEEPEFLMQNGYLVFANNGLPAGNIKIKQKFALEIINEKEAIIAGIGRGRGDTISAKMVNGNEVLIYSGYELQKIQ